MVRGSNGPHPQFRMRSEEYQGPKSNRQNEYDGYEDDAAIGSQLQPSLRLSHSDEAQMGFLHAMETIIVRTVATRRVRNVYYILQAIEWRV